ncbi:uncharacterized protein LOC108270136 isoform X2 [Ictalurus punctatus]|uniref:Uncharacterized protein LOC108270136 isoform X2 n=1 Tax=Ictalurus punctatus TaxID=7998 RepID=A0A2D0RNB4_ICTPU|nr:uncharacterized protein LOC108270136 isoform X2 [Ictalurus punctatus]
MSEGVVGRGVFGSMVLPSRPEVAACPEQDESINKASWEPPAGIYGHSVSGSHVDCDDSPEPDEATKRVKLSKIAMDKMRQHWLEQQEAQPTPRMRQSLRHVTSEVTSDEAASLQDEIIPVTLKKDSNEQVELRPFSRPELALTQSFRLLNSDDWEKKIEGLMFLRCLARYHSDVLNSRLHEVCLAVIQEKRAKLSKIAMDKMRQHWLEQREAQPTPRMRQSLRHVTSEVTSDEAASLQDEIIPVTLKKDSNEQVELRPFSRPELALTQSFRLLNSDDWEKKIKGLMFLRCLARYHSDVLNSRLHEVCLAVIQEVGNQRSGVSRIAMVTLGELYSGLQKGMDQELEATAKVLLHKTGKINAFIRQLADAALGSMVQNCTPTRSMNALLAGGLGHLNAAVRRCTAQHLTTLVEKIGTGRLLSGTKNLTDRILPAVSKLAQDSSPETRYFGRQMLLFLSSHRDFDKMVEKYIPPKDLATVRDTVVTLKTKFIKKDPNEQVELRPFSRPELALTQSFRLLNSDDWEKKIEGLMFLRCLARYHSDVLNSRLHEVCLALVQEVRNQRSGVSRIAMVTLGELYSGLQKGMDQELEATAKVLLHKTGKINAFIRQLADAALGSMVQNCTPTRSMNALLAGGLGHLNAAVRRCTAQHLTTLVEKIGTGRLLSGTKNLTDRILPAVSKLAQDSSPETRYFGRQMLLFLSSHRDFDKMVEKYIPPKDLATVRDTVVTLKTKFIKKDPNEQVELRPFSRPELALTQSFRLLNSDDWEKKIEGLMFLRRLARYHSDVLNSRLHEVCLAVIQEVRNQRSGVSRIAMVTLGELYSGLQKGMDQELEATAKVLLHKTGKINAFIRQLADAALGSMVQNCTPTRSMNALLAGGLGHLNPGVRRCTAQHLTSLVEKIGTGRLLSGTKNLTDRILPAVSKLAQDSSPETRYFGRQMLLFLSSHRDFDKMLEKYIPPKDLATVRDTVVTLKTKFIKKDPNEQVELRPFSRPELALTQSFRLLNSDDWEKKIEGLMFLRCLARYHSDVLNSRLHEVCLALVQEVRNQRSRVSRIAMVTLGELYSGLQKGMDQELEATAKVLLHKTGKINAFIRHHADAALGSMVQNCTPTRSMNALLAGGLGHLNAAVRKYTAQHLTTLVEKIGTGQLLSDAKDLTDRILPAVSKLAQDSSPETRYFGRQMLLLLSSHRDFDKMVEKYIPPKDLATVRDTVVTLKTKIDCH